MSALDVVSALSADSSVVTPLLDNVSPCMASVRMAPAAHGGKPVVSMMPEDHESDNHLEDGSLVQSVTVLSKDCSSARDSGDILFVDDTLDSVQCSAIRESPSPCDCVSSDLMTTHPSTASQLEKMETPTSRLSPDCCQTEDGLSLDSDAAVDPVLRREFLEELQKVRQIPICEKQRLSRIFENSGTLKLIGDLNTIISSLKDEPDMSEISYLVYSAASLVSKRRGLKTTKSTNSQTPTWRQRLDMKILTLRRAISLLLEVRKGSSGIRMLHELRLLRYRLGISCSESCEVTISRLKMEVKSKVKRTRRLEKTRKRLCQNRLFQRDAGRFYRELGKQTIQVTFPPSESEIEQYWGGILETEVHHNESAFWMRRQTDGETHQRDEQQWLPISDNEVTSCLKRMGTGSLLIQTRFMVSGSSVSRVFTLI